MVPPFRNLLIRAAATACSFFTALSLFSCAAVREQIIPSPLATDLLEQIRLQNDMIQSFGARGEVLLEAPGGVAYRGKETMAAMGPNMFLLKVFTPANAPILYLSGKDGQVTIIDFDKRTYTRIPIKAGKFQLRKGLSISTDYFTRIAVGNIPLLKTPAFSAHASESGDVAIIEINGHGSPELSQSIRVDLQPPHIIKGMVFREKGKVQYEVSFDHYAMIDGLRVPMSVVIEIPSKRTRFTIRHSQVLINPSIDPRQLAVEPPAFFQEVAASQ
jgi:hypothetical protein